MDFFYYSNTDLFMFPVNLIAGLFLLLGIWVLYRYYSHVLIVRWLSGMQASLIITTILIFMLIIEGIWGIRIFKTWPFVFLLILFLITLGLVILKRVKNRSARNFLFLLNHGGLWLALFSALLGAADREEYKMLIPLGQTEYNGIDINRELHPLPFTIRLDKFELEYYDRTETNGQTPKRFCSKLTLKSKKSEIQAAIEVNRPFRFKGYTLYQEGYDVMRGADSSYTILLIVRDPWIFLVYTGIFMLLAGAIGLILYGPIKRVYR